MRLMYDNITVAIKVITEEGIGLRLVDGVDPFFVPLGLFKADNKTEALVDIVNWLSDRVFPKDRMGAKQLLIQLGLKDYSIIGIVRINGASLIEDGWWFSFNDTDEFRTFTVRGAAGFPEWEDDTPVLNGSSIFRE